MEKAGQLIEEMMEKNINKKYIVDWRIIMILENKLNITNEADLAREEERISKIKAKKIFETGYLENLEPGTYETLCKIHKYLFEDIYDFAGKLRKVNIAKGNFRFAPLTYIEAAIKNVF